MKIYLILAAAAPLFLAGCGTPSYQAGEYDGDDDAYRYGMDSEPEASSLFEMSVGGGDTKVTKNLPADAVNKIGDAVRSTRDRNP